MKKRVITILLALVLSVSFVFAGSYDLVSFSKEPSQAIVVGKGDEVRFNLLNGTHTIVFDKVADVGFRFTGYAYMDDKMSVNGFATRKWSSHVDLNRDNVSDLVVAFYSAEKDKKTNETYVTVLFKLEEDLATGNVVKDSGVVKESKPLSKYLGPIGLLTFVLVLIVVARRIDKKKKVEPAKLAE